MGAQHSAGMDRVRDARLRRARRLRARRHRRGHGDQGSGARAGAGEADPALAKPHGHQSYPTLNLECSPPSELSPTQTSNRPGSTTN
jgi:hypothetical protein